MIKMEQLAGERGSCSFQPLRWFTPKPTSRAGWWDPHVTYRRWAAELAKALYAPPYPPGDSRCCSTPTTGRLPVGVFLTPLPQPRIFSKAIIAQSTYVSRPHGSAISPLQDGHQGGPGKPLPWEIQMESMLTPDRKLQPTTAFSSLAIWNPPHSGFIFHIYICKWDWP